MTASEPDALEASIAQMAARALGATGVRIEWLPGELGLRRFARVRLEGGTHRSAVARVEAPEDPAGRPAGIPAEPPLEPIRALYEEAGLPVPARFGADPAAGVELLEDVGDAPLRDVVAGAPEPERRALYQEACDLIPRIQAIAPADIEAFRRRLDAPLFAYKAELFAEHALTARGRPSTSAERETVRAAFAAVAAEAAAAPARLAHRDLQSANLHVLFGRAPGERLAMIDLQGALLAPPEYDLVCLLRDSYVELPEPEVADQLERIRPHLPDAPDPEVFARRFDLLTLTRKGKDLARFLYAARARGDERYLRYVPGTLRVLRAAAERSAGREPAFAPLAELIAEIPETPCAG
jgi:hypothetical protein